MRLLTRDNMHVRMGREQGLSAVGLSASAAQQSKTRALRCSKIRLCFSNVSEEGQLCL